MFSPSATHVMAHQNLNSRNKAPVFWLVLCMIVVPISSLRTSGLKAGSAGAGQAQAARRGEPPAGDAAATSEGTARRHLQQALAGGAAAADLLSGAAAAAALASAPPARLEAIAAAAGWTPARVRRELSKDASLKYSPSTGGLVYACNFAASAAAASGGAASAPVAGSPAAAAAAAAAAGSVVGPAAIVPPGQDDPGVDKAFSLHRCAVSKRVVRPGDRGRTLPHYVHEQSAARGAAPAYAR